MDDDSNKRVCKNSRRAFLIGSGLAAAAVAADKAGLISADNAEALALDLDNEKRSRKVKRVRDRATAAVLRRGFPTHKNNGEEKDHPYLGNYSKALPHNTIGEVDADAYKLMLKAISSGSVRDWERVPLGEGKKHFKNPLGAEVFDLEGLDPQQFRTAPAPRIDEARNSAEMVELYWEALCRDVHFSDYETDPLVATACAELNRLSGYDGPTTGGAVTPQTVFRGLTPGDLTGPYLSQFLLREVPMGTLVFPQLNETVLAGSDYLTTYLKFLFAQNGTATEELNKDLTKRFIRNGRDLANYVHVDRLFQPFLNAALIIQFRMVPGYDYQFGNNAPFSPGLPYHSHSNTMNGFCTWDYPHLHALLSTLMLKALRVVWFQKWHVHRKLRPEEFGGRVHIHKIGSASYPIDNDVLSSEALSQIYAKFGSYLLPQAYSEGAPTHPAYPSGHATVCGASATILKAWFKEDYVITDPVIPDSDGLQLLPYTGPDADKITLGGEINKLAYNVAIARNWAGIHWRSDAIAGLKLGEEVAISYLKTIAPTFKESFRFSFTRFDGSRVVIEK